MVKLYMAGRHRRPKNQRRGVVATIIAKSVTIVLMSVFMWGYGVVER